MNLVTPPLALADVFAEHRSQLKRAAHRILGDTHNAEDAVHDACVKAMEAAGAQAPLNQPLSYAHQVVRNIAIDRHRRGAFEARLFEPGDDGAQVAAPAARTPEAMAIDRQELTRVARALASLPERVRRAFELYRLEGCTQREIGAELGVSAATVNGLLREALACCHAALKAP